MEHKASDGTNRDYLSIEEAAKIYGLGGGTFRRMYKSGVIEGGRLNPTSRGKSMLRRESIEKLLGRQAA